MHQPNKIAFGSSTYSFENMLIKNNNIPSDMKRLITDACAKLCCYNLRLYETVLGREFELLCQILLDIRKKITRLIEALEIIPDTTAISRRVHTLAEGMNDSFLLGLTVVFF